MILCDTGIIVAEIRPGDGDHKRAFDALSNLREPVMTTWPCITEAMYLLHQHSKRAQERLQDQIQAGVFLIHTPSYQTALRACALMRQYADIPMDFADASLVVAAEEIGTNQILTFDRHFYAYRIYGRDAFEVLP